MATKKSTKKGTAKKAPKAHGKKAARKGPQYATKKEVAAVKKTLDHKIDAVDHKVVEVKKDFAEQVRDAVKAGHAKGLPAPAKGTKPAKAKKAKKHKKTTTRGKKCPVALSVREASLMRATRALVKSATPENKERARKALAQMRATRDRCLPGEQGMGKKGSRKGKKSSKKSAAKK